MPFFKRSLLILTTIFIQMSSKPILVTGTHRSGTTWVGQMLSLDKHVLYIHEPFNILLQSERGRAVPLDKWYEDVSFYEDNKQFAIYRYLLGFQSLTPKNIFKNSYKRQAFASLNWIKRKIFPGSRFLYKDPLALLSAPWFHQKMSAEVIVLIRHPAAFSASLKVKGWNFPFNDLASQESIMTNIPQVLREGVLMFASERPGIIEQACLLWNILHHYILSYQDKYPGWIFIRHEDLSRSPVTQFHSLYDALGLKFTKSIEQKIINSSQGNKRIKSDKVNTLKRDSNSNITNWKKILTPQEITFIKAATESVCEKFYTEEDW